MNALRLVLVAGLGLAPVHASEVSIDLDAQSSRVEFVLKATLHQVEGSFGLEPGGLRFDPARHTISGSVAVDARSGQTGNRKRDRKMHGEVLESEHYPRIVFTPVAFTGDFSPEGTSRLELRGTLSLHGGDHELTLPVEVTTHGERVEATTRFHVPYVEWGLEDPSVFVLRVAKEVEVSVTLVGTLRTTSSDSGK